MAVSNAFGSNSFNIMVGLGLPWMLYTFSTNFQPYHGLRDEGINESVVILASVLAVFVVFVVPSGFVSLCSSHIAVMELHVMKNDTNVGWSLTPRISLWFELCSFQVIHKWHGVLFIILYVAYLAYEIGRVYWPE